MVHSDEFQVDTCIVVAILLMARRLLRWRRMARSHTQPRTTPRAGCGNTYACQLQYHFILMMFCSAGRRRLWWAGLHMGWRHTTPCSSTRARRACGVAYPHSCDDATFAQGHLDAGGGRHRHRHHAEPQGVSASNDLEMLKLLAIISLKCL